MIIEKKVRPFIIFAEHLLISVHSPPSSRVRSANGEGSCLVVAGGGGGIFQWMEGTCGEVRSRENVY